MFLGSFGILCQRFSDFEQIFLEIWQREDRLKIAILKDPRSLFSKTPATWSLSITFITYCMLPR